MCSKLQYWFRNHEIKGWDNFRGERLRVRMTREATPKEENHENEKKKVEKTKSKIRETLGVEKQTQIRKK